VAPCLLFSLPVQPKQRVSRCAGFTLIELLVVLAIAAIAMGLGIPALHNFIVRSRTEGAAREASMTLQRCRLEAIKSNREVIAHLDGNEIVCFVDADRDQTFNPDASAPYRTADWIVSEAGLTSDKLAFRDPDNDEDDASLGGFAEAWGKDGAIRGAVFQPNGSVAEQGAFRIADVRSNFLEVRVAPAATGRIEIRKCLEGAVNPEPAEGDEDFDCVWVPFGDPADPDHQPWTWN
jgi:prepilin-type N-terminal cleavage/methylation domain-containing protein